MQLAGSLTVASIHSVRGQSEASGPDGPSAPKQSNFRAFFGNRRIEGSNYRWLYKIYSINLEMNDWHIGKSGYEDQAEKNGKNPTEDQKYSWHPGTDVPDTGSRGVF